MHITIKRLQLDPDVTIGSSWTRLMVMFKCEPFSIGRASGRFAARPLADVRRGPAPERLLPKWR